MPTMDATESAVVVIADPGFERGRFSRESRAAEAVG